MPTEKPGIAYEKIVAAIQAQIDPSAAVTHDEKISDRLGQLRQFDVVVRGTFAGQSMLGVIECKDLGKKVGTPEVDGFVTKSQDVNANFKILMSRSGFSKPALAKCHHYGIQALSLIKDDPVNKNFFIGVRWEADVIRWGQLAVSLEFVENQSQPVHCQAEEVRISGKKVLDWYTNYLLDTESTGAELGWVASIKVEFDSPQLVEVSPGSEYLCKAISLMAERVCDKFETRSGISGAGFFDWNSKRATFPPNTQIVSEAVEMDFSRWTRRTEGEKEPTGFLDLHMNCRANQFEKIADVLELDKL